MLRDRQIFNLKNTVRGPKSKRDLKLSEIKERNGSFWESKIYEILFKIGDYKSSNNNSKLGD